MRCTRRDFGKLALSALPAVPLLTQPRLFAGQETSPKSPANFGGVNVGIIAPYAFRGSANSIDDILKGIVELGLTSVEMQAEPVEAYAGAPARSRGGRGGQRGGNPPGGQPKAGTPDTAQAAERREGGGNQRGPEEKGPPRGRGRGPATPEQIAAQRSAGEEMRKWRLSQSMAKFEEIRKKYNDAGVAIEIVKFGLGAGMTDEEVDYCFQVAKTLGCHAITCEPPVSETRRLGQFAEKHQIRLGFHNHADATSVESFCRPGAWEQAFFYSDWNGANVDIGHFCAGNSVSPVDFLRLYHNRITNIHLKDRKFNQGPNVPWGQGDTPLAEVLQMMKQQKYRFMATIELEYPVPEGSSVMAELKKCVEFCQAALA